MTAYTEKYFGAYSAIGRLEHKSLPVLLGSLRRDSRKRVRIVLEASTAIAQLRKTYRLCFDQRWEYVLLSNMEEMTNFIDKTNELLKCAGLPADTEAQLMA